MNHPPHPSAAPQTVARNPPRPGDQATIEVLAEQGYARTTLTDVARRAGISHGINQLPFPDQRRAGRNPRLSLRRIPPELARRPRRRRTLRPATRRPTPRRFRAHDLHPGPPLRGCRSGARRKAARSAASQMRRKWPNLHHQTGRNLRRANSRRPLPRRPHLISRVLRVTSEGVWVDLISTREPYSATGPCKPSTPPPWRSSHGISGRGCCWGALSDGKTTTLALWVPCPMPIPYDTHTNARNNR